MPETPSTSAALVVQTPEGMPAMLEHCRLIYDERDQIIGHATLAAAEKQRRIVSAIERFITEKEPRDDARRATRVLECAVGAALGPAPDPADSQRTDLDPSLAGEGSVIDYHDRHRFRLMFEWRDLWEPVLAKTALSRAQVLQMIDHARRPRPPLPEGQWDVILADPPWRYDFAPTEESAIERHYPTLPVEAICNFVADDGRPMTDVFTTEAVLFLWATAPKLREALQVLDAWGFAYKTHAVWDKERPGMGHWFMGQHELLLVGTKGNFSPPTAAQRIASVIHESRGAHSVKPGLVPTLIEEWFPRDSYLELFGRVHREKWVVWGNDPNVANGS
jgi:N6-adenosine-specific RNA methylase IME4